MLTADHVQRLTASLLELPYGDWHDAERLVLADALEDEGDPLAAWLRGLPGLGPEWRLPFAAEAGLLLRVAFNFGDDGEPSPVAVSLRRGAERGGRPAFSISCSTWLAFSWETVPPRPTFARRPWLATDRWADGHVIFHLTDGIYGQNLSRDEAERSRREWVLETLGVARWASRRSGKRAARSRPPRRRGGSDHHADP